MLCLCDMDTVKACASVYTANLTSKETYSELGVGLFCLLICLFVCFFKKAKPKTFIVKTSLERLLFHSEMKF